VGGVYRRRRKARVRRSRWVRPHSERSLSRRSVELPISALSSSCSASSITFPTPCGRSPRSPAQRPPSRSDFLSPFSLRTHGCSHQSSDSLRCSRGRRIETIAAPAPGWSELGGHLVVDGPVYLTSYVGTWYVWLATFIVLAAVEYGLRQHYRIGNGRLRNLPPVPLSRRAIVLVAVTFGGTFGVAVGAWMARIDVNPPEIVPVLVVTTALAAAVPVGAAVARGLIAPIVCFFALVVPVLLNQAFVGGEGGPVCFSSCSGRSPSASRSSASLRALSDRGFWGSSTMSV